MFTLLKARKNICKTLSMLILANKKVYLENQIIFILSNIENHVMTMSYFFRAKLMIFDISIPVD